MTVNNEDERSLMDSSPCEPTRDSHLSYCTHIGDVGGFKLREKTSDKEDGDSDEADSDTATVVDESSSSNEKKQDVWCKDSETSSEWTCSTVQAWVTLPAQDKPEFSNNASQSQNETPIFAYWQQWSRTAVWNCPVLGTFDVTRERSANGEFSFSALRELNSVIASC